MERNNMPTQRLGVPAKHAEPANPELELISIRDVTRITARSRSAIYADPTFPQPIALGHPGSVVRCSRWLKHEVLEWVRGRIAIRDAQDGPRRARLQERQQRLAAQRRDYDERRITQMAEAK
jgi:predicted DNA-binding transcriptional regulator AlpA